MLPDYPRIKSRISKILLLRMKLSSWSKLGPLSQVRKKKVQEGDEYLFIRMDGTQDKTEFNEIKAEFILNKGEVENITMPDLIKLTDKTADEIAEKTAKKMYEGIGKGCDSVGNTVDAQGKPMSPDLFFKVLDKLQIDFDDAGKPMLPSVIVSDEKIGKKLLKDLKSNPKNDKIFTEIIDKKRREFYDREANRKLVD